MCNWGSSNGLIWIMHAPVNVKLKWTYGLIWMAWMHLSMWTEGDLWLDLDGMDGSVNVKLKETFGLIWMAWMHNAPVNEKLAWNYGLIWVTWMHLSMWTVGNLCFCFFYKDGMYLSMWNWNEPMVWYGCISQCVTEGNLWLDMDATVNVKLRQTPWFET